MDLLHSQHIDELDTLLALAETGSFASAGRLLERHPSVLSKRLTALERRLGIRLVERTTRRLHLTDEGARLVERVQQAMALLSNAQKEAAEGALQVRGRLRLSLPAALGRLWLSPLMAEFSAAYPQVLLDIEYTDRIVDLVGERIDAAIRIGELRDSRLLATRLCDSQRILGASPDYLARCGVPGSPAELAEHNCLGFTGLVSHPDWHLTPLAKPPQADAEPAGAATQTVRVRGSMVSNDNEALLTAALKGIGIVAGGDWFLAPHLQAGTLVRVLPQWQLGCGGGIYFIRPSAQFSSAAMAAFRSWLIQRFGSALWRK